MNTIPRAAVICLFVGSLIPLDLDAQTRQRIDPKTASIVGTVTTTTGAPVRGAEVRVASDASYRRLVTTDGEGRFELTDMPAGDYRLTVSRSGFTPMQYGQRRPFEAPSVVHLSEGERYRANVALTRGGAIEGRVVDRFGEPVAGTRVQVLRSRMVQGQRRLQSMGQGDQTDDTGAFRIWGLPQGDYYVTVSVGPVDAVKRNPPVYYPGTPSFAEAIPISLSAGGEATADFQLAPIRNARVSGIVLNASGAPSAAMVQLASEVVGMGPALAVAFVISTDSGPDGRFTFDNVPPGPYTLRATASFDPFLAGAAAAATQAATAPSDVRRTMDAMMVSGPPATAVMPLVVTGEDVSELTLATQRGGTLNVRFVPDSGVVRPLPRNLRVNARATTPGGMSMTHGGTSRTEFTLVSPGGPFYLDVGELPEDWVVSAIVVDGVDVTDQPIDLKGQNASARIVLTDRVSEVSGVVQSRDDPSQHTVVIFPDDSARWTYPSRFVRTAKADADGRFRVSGLPSNERYVALAVDYLEEGEEQDPQVLEQLRSRATSFSLGEGEQRSIWLDLVTR